MGRFVKGEVISIYFPFSDLKGSKRRPAVVVANLSGNDQILCQITSQDPGDPYSINLSDSDFSSGRLPKPNCFIRPNKLFTAANSTILERKGKLNDVKMREIINEIDIIIS